MTAARISSEALASIVEVSRKSFLVSLVQLARRPVEGSRKTVLTALACGREVMIMSCSTTRYLVSKRY